MQSSSLRRLVAAYSLSKQMVLLLVLMVTVATNLTPLSAQAPTRDPRRQFVEGLLQSLIESQLDRRAPPSPNRPPLPRPDENLIAARKHLDGFSTHSNELVTHWNANAARSPGTRQMLGDLIKLNASVANVRARSANAGRLEDLKPDFVNLDRDWRLMSYRLQQMDDLGADCVRCIGHLNQIDAALCELLDVSPQVDFHALATETIAINTSLSHLIQDIEFELPRSRTGRSLIAEASQVQQRALQLSDVVSQRRSYDEIVGRFRAFYGEWRSLAGKIRQVDSRHLERNVTRIEESAHAIHELLWLAEDVDYGRLSYLATALRRDVDGLFNVVSLNVLLELPAANRVLPVAGEFYGLCENFTQSVESHAPLRQLQSDYRYLIQSWPELSGSFSPCRNPAVTQSLKAIEESFVALRDAIGLAAPIDWQHVNEVAAALVISADNAMAEVQQHVYSNARYDQQFRFESARDAAAFRGAARRLHEAIVNRQTELLADRTAAAAQAWTGLNERCFRRLPSADQVHLRQLQASATQQVVELQAILQL
ncbi:MAG: hypothetical protein H6823_06770 [Planctomycetaceae bacterium]|nr:hypothetical protein [Planctomycetaceae bacterium]